MKLFNLQLSTILVLALTAVVNAVPTSTLSEISSTETSVVAESTLALSVLSSDNSTNSEFAKAEAARLANEFFGPASVLLNGQSSKATTAKVLPAVPGTIALTLVGFLCVSLVRDRQAWITATRSIFNLAQTSIKIIPQLTINSIDQGITNAPSHTITMARNSDDRAIVAGNPASTNYIGLLHRLATIPGDRLNTLTKNISTKTQTTWQAMSVQVFLCAKTWETSEPIIAHPVIK